MNTNTTAGGLCFFVNSFCLSISLTMYPSYFLILNITSILLKTELQHFQPNKQKTTQQMEVFLFIVICVLYLFYSSNFITVNCKTIMISFWFKLTSIADIKILIFNSKRLILLVSKAMILAFTTLIKTNISDLHNYKIKYSKECQLLCLAILFRID